MTNIRKRVTNIASEPTMIEISTALGTYTFHEFGRYCLESEVATIRNRSVYIPILIMMERINIGTNDVLKRFEISSNGAAAQNRIISQYNGA